MENAKKRPISEILKKRRKELGMSAADVCYILKETDNIEISVSTLYGYENGHRKPTPETLLALCDIYDLNNLMVSFGYASTRKPITDLENNYITVERDQMLNALETAFSILNEQGRKSVIEYAKILAGNPDYQNAVAEAILEVAEKTEKPSMDSTQPHDGK